MAKDKEPETPTTITSSTEIPESFDDSTVEELKTYHSILVKAFTEEKTAGKAANLLKAKEYKSKADQIAVLVGELQSFDDNISQLPEPETQEVVAEETSETPVAEEVPVVVVEVPDTLPEPAELVTAAAELPSEGTEEIKTASVIYTAAQASDGTYQPGKAVSIGNVQDMLNKTLRSGVTQETKIASRQYDGVPIIHFSDSAEDNMHKLMAAHVPGSSGSATARARGYSDDTKTRTAAWGCDPSDVDRTVISCVVRGRPVAESFPTIVADRLALKYPGKGTYVAGTYVATGSGLISTRTSGSTAIDYSTRSTWKTILDFVCGTEEAVVLTEFIAALRVTEQNMFSSPETVQEAITRLDAQLDIEMEKALLTALDTKITLHTYTGTLASNSISRAIAQEKFQILQNGNYTSLDDYKVYVNAGLLDLIYADQAGRANPPDDISKFAADLIGIHDMEIVIIRGGTDPSLVPSAQANGAIPVLPTAWPIRIINPDNFRLIHGPEGDYNVGEVPRDLELLLTNARAFFARNYEGLVDVGKCVQGKVTVTVPLDSASRAAAATTI